ncbi:MAG: M10 family metallopeptidase C-terminal domain-containing protein, partial [Rickettsiales bacterium]
NPYDAIYTNRAWATDGDGITRITYTFSSANGNGDDYDGTPTSLFSSSQQTAMRAALTAIERVTRIDFIETSASGAGQANLAMRQFNYDDPTILGHVSSLPGYPGYEIDIDFGMYTGFNAYNPDNGDFTTLIHELGHALGLDHPHENGYGSDILIPSLDDERATVMSYYNYVADSGNVFYVETPQIYDIAVLQDKYGINTGYNSGNTTYDLSSASYQQYAGTLWDAGGTDTYDARGISSSLTIDLREGMDYITHFGNANPGLYSNESFIWTAFGSNIENAYGGSGNDTIHGNDLANTLIGYSGNDTIIGYRGNDSINGHYGNDTVNGHYGNDYLRGGAGNDTVRGGADNDTLRGDKGDDTIRGDKGNDAQWGDAGNDYLNGHEGADTLRGGAGNDEVRGGSENDIVIGDGGNDTLKGDKGNDLLDGGAGRDILYGG